MRGDGKQEKHAYLFGREEGGERQEKLRVSLKTAQGREGKPPVSRHVKESLRKRRRLTERGFSRDGGVVSKP